MRWLRLVVRVLIALAIADLLVLTGLFFYMSQPDQLPEREPVPDYSASELDEKVGEYQMPDGPRALLTFSAHGGLQLYALVNARFSRDEYLSSRIAPDPDGGFTWHPDDAEPARELVFIEDQSGVAGFEWRDAEDRLRSARRVDAGFRQEDITWNSGPIALAGTAFLPDAKVGAGAVMIHGSGNNDRDNLWYVHVALRLARSGVAVLLPDKRGNGRSEGDWRVAHMTDFAIDALTGRGALARAAGIAEAEIGLVGISQGGMVTGRATALAGDLPFVINISGAAVTLDATLAHETVQSLRAVGIPSFMNPAMHPYAVAIAKRRRATFWENNGDYDPLPDWAGAEVPLLVVYGEEDEFDNVPVAASVERLRGLAERADVEVLVFEGLGHALLDPLTREIEPRFLTAVSDWVLTHSGSEETPLRERLRAPE